MLYDVFICHASEDKKGFVQPLAEALRCENVVVWYDEFELRPGDSLRKSIDLGLSKSRHGIVVLSPAFFGKHWPERELGGLVARQMRGEERVVIPLWYNVTSEDVLEYSPPLADLVAISSHRGLAAVVAEIVRVVRPQYSPLVVARDELLAFGVTPPVISDEWWLDVVEASNRLLAAGAYIPEQCQWGRWSFPLPYEEERGERRGIRIAWTAMQLDWVKEAEERSICQITEPKEVLRFIDRMPGLKQACCDNPHWLAVYAPQLTIPGLEGDFDHLFDKMAKSKEWSDELMLRSPNLVEVDAAQAACHFVQGPMFGPSPKTYETFDYLIWLLSTNSQWLPEGHRDFLRRGMGLWATWASDLEEVFLEWLMTKARQSGDIYPTPAALQALRARIADSAKTLRLAESAEDLTSAFLKNGFIRSDIEQWNRRARKNSRGE